MSKFKSVFLKLVLPILLIITGAGYVLSQADIAAWTPASVNKTTLGSAALPFTSVFVGNAATNNFKITGVATAARTITFPDSSFTMSGSSAVSCGTSTTCAATATVSPKIAFGECTAAAATTCTVTALPAFASVTSFACNATDMTTAANNALKISNVSTSSFTITTTSSSDTFGYICMGT